MANDVAKAFKTILMDVGNMSEDSAESWIQDMKVPFAIHKLRWKEVNFPNLLIIIVRTNGFTISATFKNAVTQLDITP